MYDIIKGLNLNQNIKTIRSVSGGDINKAFYIETTDNNQCFLKVNDAVPYPRMFEKEAQGLKLLHQNTTLNVPNVLQVGCGETKQFLLLEWIEKGMPKQDFWEQFGTALAKMHKKPQLFFGLEEDNFIGSLPQLNTKCESWGEFYTNNRLMPLMQKLYSRGQMNEKDIAAVENLCKKIDEIFPRSRPHCYMAIYGAVTLWWHKMAMLLFMIRQFITATAKWISA